MERIIKSRTEATRDQASVRAQQSPWNVRGRADGQGLTGEQGYEVVAETEQQSSRATALAWNVERLVWNINSWENPSTNAR